MDDEADDAVNDSFLPKDNIETKINLVGAKYDHHNSPPSSAAVVCNVYGGSTLSLPTAADNVDSKENESVALDGGWGWFVIFITFIINAFVAGTTFTLGVSIPPLWDRFEVSEAAATVVGSVMILAIMSAGPIVGFLVAKFGCRPVMNIGGIINFIGAITCTYSTNLPTMIVLFGFVTGLGLGFLYISAIIIVGYYFKKRIALASGIAMCGTSVGTFAFNPLREYLQDTYDWNVSTSIFGALGIVCSILSMLLWLPEPEEDLYTRLWKRFRHRSSPPLKPPKVEEPILSSDNVENEESVGCGKKLCRMMSKSTLLRNKLLWLFLLSSALTMMGFAVPLVFMGQDGKDKGIDKTKAVFLFSIIAASDGVGRFALGLFCQKTGVSPLKIKTVWIAIASASAIMTPFFDQYAALGVFSCLIGLGYGSYIAMVLPIFVSLVERKHIAAAVGAENLFSGIAIAICAPVAGLLYGAQGNLSTAFYYSGVSLAGAVVVNIIIMISIRKSNNNNPPDSTAINQ